MTAAAPPLAVDRALPGRDVLLDGEAFTAHAVQTLGRGRVAATHARRVRATYKPGRNLRVVHSVEINGETMTIAARAFPLGRAVDMYPAPASLEGPLDGVGFDAGLRAMFWTVPYDRRLDQLRSVGSDPSFDKSPGLEACVSSRLVAYAPEKSATVQCLDADGRAVGYARLFGNTDGSEEFSAYERLHCALVGSGGPGLPRPLAYAPRARAFVTAAVPGRSLADSHAALHAYPSHRDFPTAAATGRHEWRDVFGDLRLLGTALARLHATGAPVERRFRRFDDARLEYVTGMLDAVRPDIGGLARSVAEQLASSRCDDSDAPVCLHGDVQPQNAIVSGDTLSLIDFEEASLGPASADIGSLFAGLRYLRCVHAIDAATEQLLANAVTAGYLAARPLPGRHSLLWHTAAALLVERAGRSVTRIRTAGLQHLQEILRAAGQLLQQIER